MLFSLFYATTHFAIISKYIKYYKQELILSIILTFYVVSVCGTNGDEGFTMLKNMFLWVVFSTIVPIFLIKVVLAKDNNLVFWDVILDLGFIASLISCLALVSPSLNTFLRNIQIDVSDSGGVTLEQMGFRGFGFANYLTSSYGYLQGLAASLCILRFDKKHKRFALYFLTMTMSVIINARTGLFPILMAICYLFLSSIVQIKLVKLTKYFIFGLAGVLVIVQILRSFPDIYDFILDFIEQLSVIFLDDDGFGQSAYSKMLFFPESITGLLFGEGHSVFGTGEIKSSDIGYVNQIFLGGIVFALGLILYETIIYMKIMKRSVDKVFPTIFFVSILVFNYKGVPFYNNVSFVNLWILYYYVLVHNKLNPCHRIRLV